METRLREAQQDTLVELIVERARRRPEHEVLNFVGTLDVTDRWTWAEVRERAQAIAAALQQSSRVGDRAVLLFEPGLEFVAAFLGCLLSGVVAVPVAAPARARIQRMPQRMKSLWAGVRGIVTDCEANSVLAQSEFIDAVAGLVDGDPVFDKVHWLATDEVPLSAATVWIEPLVGPDSTAFLQYTSGSTSRPKGVIVSHANILANEQLIKESFRQGREKRILSWLPHYHDMGLIGGILQPLYADATGFLMSPVTFLQNPYRWLEAISKLGITTSGAPNFGYEHCLKRITPEQRGNLDLSAWEVAFNGAEPIRADTLKRFAQTFAPAGFDMKAFHPCYGLAEATLLVTCTRPADSPYVRTVDSTALQDGVAVESIGRDEKRLVSSGRISAAVQVRISDPQTGEACDDGQVGEIWVHSAGVAQGYWNRPAETEQSFIDCADGKRYLRTGDLGFCDSGHLYVTGRLKDLIIIRGANHYPQDLELTAQQSSPWLRPGAGAAFSVAGADGEGVVLVHELVPRHDDAGDLVAIGDAIRDAVSSRHEIQLMDVVLIPAGHLPTTTSGKVQRSRARMMYQRGQIKPLFQSRPATAATEDEKPVAIDVREVADCLREQVAVALRIEPKLVRMDVPVCRLGIDSLTATEIAHRIETRFRVEVSPGLFFEEYNLPTLAGEIVASAPCRDEREGEAAASGPTALSENQKSLWFVQKMWPQSTAYNLFFAARLEAPIDTDRLCTAFDAVCARHHMLRSTIDEGIEPVWRIEAGVTPVITVHDVDELDDVKVGLWLDEEAGRPFDLTREPPLRVTILRHGGEAVLSLTLHHIAADLWSLDLLLHEVAQHYSGVLPADRTRADYGDFVAWQQDLLRKPRAQRLRDFWLDSLDPDAIRLDLPTDRLRRADRNGHGDQINLEIDAATTSRIKIVARHFGVTPYTVMLSVYALLLSRYSGQRDLLIGTPFNGRSRSEFSETIGYFVNLVGVRAEMDEGMSFPELLQQMHRRLAGAHTNGDLPFTEVMHQIKSDRDQPQSAWLPVVFAMQQARRLSGRLLAPFVLGQSGEVASIGDLRLRALRTPPRDAAFDLSLMFVDCDDTLRGALQYATDLFERDSVRRMADHYLCLLQHVLSEPDDPLGSYDLLDAVERQHLMHDLNATAQPFAAATVPELVTSQAERTPHAIAVMSAARRATYAELDRESNRLARYLRRSGIGHEDRVAVALPRGYRQIVASLAVMKAGAAFVPLDLAVPRARRDFIVADSGARMVLAADGVDCGHGQVSNWSDFEAATDLSDTPVEVTLHPGQLAYIIYTSGSTGAPKGVGVCHRSLANLVDWHCRRYEPGCADRATVLAAQGFDASVWEIWPYLCAGATLCPVPDETRISAVALRDFIVERSITLSFVPTALAESLIGLDWSDDVVLRALLTGGDRLSRCVPAALPFALINHYGPTETTVVATAGQVDDSPVPSIGKPISNTQVYVLDERMQPVPLGVAGELYIGGAGLARGYLDRAALTAQGFVPNPFGDTPGSRLYRSGDRVRYRSDGSLQFLGRVDEQLKLRGYRIEPGEIEAQLCAHGAVREAVVMLRSDAGAEARLVGYAAVGEGAQEPGLGEQLREWLAQRLPQYMVPASLVVLESLPLTANGKADRAALPAPQLERAPVSAPHTPTEIALAQLYEQLLGVEGVGREDGFFALGGHSLLATQLISRVAERFTVQLELRSVFETPQLQALAARIDEAQHSELAPIPLADRSQALPLSHAQERLWFLDRLDAAAGAAYHIPVGLRLSGELDVPALRAALDRLVYRHESLRTHFVEVEGRPRQQIGPAQAGFGLQEHDLSGLDEAARTAALQHQIAEQAQARFDLGAGPLMRGCLLRLDAAEHVLLLTQHHIVSDGWSMGVLVEEVAQLYRSYSEGGDDPLAPLSIQYADYAAWQRDSLSGAALEEQIGYWREQLSGAPALLELPTDRARPPVQGYAGDSVGLEIAPALAERLQQLSQRHGVTLFMTLLAGWSLLLSRLSGQPEVVVGTPVANRGRRELEPLIGFFVNTLALRVSLDDAPSVSQLLSQIRATTLGGYAHQDLPFEQVVEALQPARHLNHSPLFQTMLSLNNTPQMDRLPLSGLTLSALDTQLTTTQFDLSLSLSAADDGRLLGTLLYARDLFDRETVERWGGYLQRLLAAMVEDDTRCATTLGLLSETQREQVVERFNASAREVVTDTSLLHQGFERQAALRPQAVALRYGDESLSYGQLNRQANRIAARLIDAGVGPDARVGLCLQRGPQLIAAMLGILKAGGAYVPLDPQAPPARLQHLLGDAEPVALVTDTALAARLDALSVSEAALVCVDQLGDHSDPGDDGDEDNPVVTGLGGDRLAYLIYTSGSTGQPKGVMVEHRNIANLIGHWCARFGGQVEEGRFNGSFWTQFGFDVSVFEIFVTLTLGGALDIVADEVRPDPEALLRWLRERDTQLSYLPPFFVRHLERVADADIAALALRSVLVGVEPFEEAQLHRLERLIPGLKIVNAYGPTETTVFSLANDALGDRARRAPLGRPVANTGIYILDARAQPVPIGVIGEIYIGGAGVARGYFNRRALTAQRFVANPFAAGEGERLYRSGDLGRWLPDGQVEFCGRCDFQLKLRGYRIEPGEIEAQLCAHGAVREAVVMLRSDAGAEARLVGYAAVGEGAQEPGLGEQLREWLAQRLPQYMVPASLVVLESLPLTANGKADRAALPAPQLERAPVSAPHTPTEIALAQLYEQLLAVEGVGREDGFFALGGHSLLATQLISRVAERFAVQLELRSVFETPQLQALAARIDEAQHSELAPIPVADRSQALPLSHAQERLWFLEQLQPGQPVNHIAAGIRLVGTLDRAALERSLNRLAERHEILRTTFGSDNGQTVQLPGPVPTTRLECIDLGAGAERALQQRMDDDAKRAFDLGGEPPWRCRLYQLSDDVHVLSLVVHHIAADGWSIEVLAREIAELYDADCNNRQRRLAALPVQYADYASWQRTEVAALDHQVEFWKRTLQGPLPVLDLRTDRPRPAVQTYAGDSTAVRLPETTVAALRRLAHEHNATLFMVLLAGLYCVLRRMTGQHDLVLGTLVANRRRMELESLIGCFINALPLRLDLDGQPSFRAVLEHARVIASDAFANQDLPFEQIVETVQPARDVSRSPLFQIVLSLENMPQSQIRLAGLEVQPERIETNAVPVDLMFALFEDDGGLGGSVKYNSDLFDAETVSRLVHTWSVFLDAAVTGPDTEIDRLPLLSETEERRLLTAWNSTEAGHPLHLSFVEIFERHVRTRPAMLAAADATRRLTYAELDERANRIANRLIELGVEAEDVVAVYGARSCEFLCALLGILKAGACYLPLDPDQPARRVTRVLQGSQPSVVMTVGEEAGILNEAMGLLASAARPTVLAAGDPTVSAAAPTRPGTRIDPQQLAYVIFTSGTTGEPKGALVHHQGMLNHLYAKISDLRMGADDVVAQNASQCFDISVWQFLAPLTCGAQVEIIEHEAARDPGALITTLRRGGVTVLEVVPSFLSALLGTNADRLDELESLRWLLVTGEAFPPHLARAWFASVPSVPVVNAYGPTECSDDVTHHIIESGQLVTGSSVPIGRAVDNIRLYILDDALRPVPLGVAGRLYVAGVGVGRGYLGAGALTASRFLPDPFDPAGGGRLYDTGDLVTQRSDGSIEFLGRIDHQVKIRGFRIELGEIEAAILESDAVSQTVVTCVTAPGGEAQLAAFVTFPGSAAQDGQASIEALRESLRDRLPTYMIPAAFVAMDAMPLSANGKIDRKQLPGVRWEREAVPRSLRPVGVNERSVADIWKAVLGIDNVGRSEPFFEVGGDSIKLLKMHALLDREFPGRLSVVDLFRYTTIEEIAAQLDGADERPGAMAIESFEI